MLIVTIPSTIASWLWMVPGGFWLVENGFGWFAVLVVTIVTQLFAFCLTVLFVLVRLVPALIEQFFGSMLTLFSRSATLWLHFADFLWYHVLERVSSLMMSFCPLPGNMISFNRFRCIQNLLSEFDFFLCILFSP